MKRFPLVAASAAIGLALLLGAVHTVRATTTQIPPGGDKCYYHLWNCSYNSNAYWSDCDPGYPEGWVTTTFAASICGAYHDQ